MLAETLEDDEARRWLARAEAFDVEQTAGRIELAAAHALIGDENAALDELESIYQGYVWDPYHALVMTPFHELLDDPRFLDLFGVEEIT